MSIALQNRINALEQRIMALESGKTESADSLTLEKLWGEIKTIKMRMARNDGKRTPSDD